MQSTPPNSNQLQFLAPTLKEILNPKESLYRLAHAIPWNELEEEFADRYSHTGRPAKPVRLVVGLLLLKQLHNLGDETVVAQWVQNPYWQYFCGETIFQWRAPLDPSDLVHFRKRVGEAGMKKILEISIRLHGKEAQEKEVIIDTTVQEKNISFPTDSKLRYRAIQHCVKIAKKEGIQLRQSYHRTAKKLLRQQRWRRHRLHAKKARAAERKLKTIVGRLIRELERKLSASAKKKHSQHLALYQQLNTQQRHDKRKIYSLHEPQVYCVAKGKEAKRYEFGAKASVVITKKSAVIVGAINFEQNCYDGHSLPVQLQQVETLRGKPVEAAIVDGGYRGKKRIGQVEIIRPDGANQHISDYQKRKHRKQLHRRSAIEPVIGHLKSDYRLARNYLKGNLGDSINLFLSAAAWNFNKWMRNILYWLKTFLPNFAQLFAFTSFQTTINPF